MTYSDLDPEYRQICSLMLHDDEINMIGFDGTLRIHEPDFSHNCPQVFNIIKDGAIVEQFTHSKICRTRLRELAIPLDLIIIGDGKYLGKTIKNLPTWLYDELVDISTA